MQGPKSLLPISLGWWLRWEIPTKMISTRELGLQQITPKTKPQTQTIKTWMINYQMTKNPTHPFSSKKVTPPQKKEMLETMPFSWEFQFEWKTRWRCDSSGGDCGASASIGRVVSLSIQAYGSRSLLVNSFRYRTQAPTLCQCVYIYISSVWMAFWGLGMADLFLGGGKTHRFMLSAF